MNTQSTPTHRSDYELDRRLRAVVRPFTPGAAYGRGHVDRELLDGGVSRAVSCLAIRSRERATAADVAHELNAAHLAATGWSLRDTSARAALADVVVAVCPEMIGAAADTAAVLLLDALGGAEDGARAFAALHYGLGTNNNRRTDIVGAIRTAAALHAAELTGGAK